MANTLTHTKFNGILEMFLSHNALFGHFFTLQLFCLHIIVPNFVIFFTSFVFACICIHSMCVYAYVGVCLHVCFSCFSLLFSSVYLFALFYSGLIFFYLPICFLKREKRHKQTGGKVGRTLKEMRERKLIGIYCMKKYFQLKI